MMSRRWESEWCGSQRKLVSEVGRKRKLILKCVGETTSERVFAICVEFEHSCRDYF